MAPRSHRGRPSTRGRRAARRAAADSPSAARTGLSIDRVVAAGFTSHCVGIVEHALGEVAVEVDVDVELLARAGLRHRVVVVVAGEDQRGRRREPRSDRQAFPLLRLLAVRQQRVGREVDEDLGVVLRAPATMPAAARSPSPGSAIAGDVGGAGDVDLEDALAARPRCAPAGSSTPMPRLSRSSTRNSRVVDGDDRRDADVAALPRIGGGGVAGELRVDARARRRPAARADRLAA